MNPERRLYPRLKVNIAAELETPDSSLDVTLKNISLGGLLIETTMELMALVESRPQSHLECNIHFGLGDAPMHCRCRLVYQNRLSQNALQAGLSIVSIDQDSAQRLQDFILQNL